MLAAVGQPVVAAVALTTYGVGTSVGMIAYQTTMQTLVPAEARGRVFSFYDALWNATRLVSLGLGGLVASAFSIRAVYLLAGVLLFAASAAGLGIDLTPGDGA